MTSQGSPYTRFSRALKSQNLVIAEQALAELPRVGCDDALEILALMAWAEDERYDRAAAKWAAKATRERDLDVEASRRLLAMAELLPQIPALLDPLRQAVRAPVLRDPRPSADG